jgi:phosphoglycolate phosphatase-like HAD superfamily hydrolase
MTRAWLFDLDGTLADVRHRRHFVTTKPKNWAAWNAAQPRDPVNEPVADLARALKASGMAVVLVSGRGNDFREPTVEWLNRHNVPFDALFMRASKDHRADDIIKLELLAEVEAAGWEPVAVVDDRPRVVRMWREHGLFVFDVNQSGEEF